MTHPPMTPVSIEGSVAKGFEGVRSAFAENFAIRGELGAACCIYRYGEKVIDLWGGVRDKVTGASWELLAHQALERPSLLRMLIGMPFRWCWDR